MEYIGCLRRENRWFLIVISLFYRDNSSSPLFYLPPCLDGNWLRSALNKKKAAWEDSSHFGLARGRQRITWATDLLVSWFSKSGHSEKKNCRFLKASNERLVMLMMKSKSIFYLSWRSLRANYLALFKRTSISISTKKELKINESKIACCPITLFVSLVELWKGENLNKVTLGNSYWTRESQYDIGRGFFQRNDEWER